MAKGNGVGEFSWVSVEPFTGGAGVAMRLLRDEYIDYVVINDLDAGVAAFWRSVFGRTEELAQATARWRQHGVVPVRM